MALFCGLLRPPAPRGQGPAPAARRPAARCTLAKALHARGPYPRELSKKERKSTVNQDDLLSKIASDDIIWATFRVGSRDVPIYASFDTGPHRRKRFSVGYKIWLMAEGGATADASRAWVDLVEEVAASLDVVHGVLGVFDSADVALSDITGIHTFLNDQELHPWPNEISQTEYSRPELGDQYVRHPRWGTLLAQKHVDAIGGRETITREVSPAAVRDVGNDTSFIQLTPIEDALSAVAEEKRQALARLMQPILVPEID